MAPITTDAPYRATPDPEGDSQSSSSNSPARADYEESDFYAGNNDSQSSIGVPTFQDMAVSEESCEPPANRLPAEVLIGIFSKLSSPTDLLNCMRVSKRWARNSVDLLWHRPACTTWNKHGFICRTLSLPDPYFAYRDFIKRLNLAALSDGVNDGSVTALQFCKRVERLTLTGCDGLSDGGLVGLLEGNHHLLALDISGDTQITEASMYTLADNCKRLQGLNISNCTRISNQSMIAVAENCKYIKRLKLNDCDQLEDVAIMAFANNCPNILEIDLHQCKSIGNGPVHALLSNGQTLRELRLANCELISDEAFLTLPPTKKYEHLRILDLTSCARLTDRAVERIIEVASRLRNLVFAKCRNLTDVAVNEISKLGKNLHYLHLGHCGHITDQAVIKLVQSCNRIRYIDLGCCVHLTDQSVTKLATLPKLRRIGLVKCSNITDASVYALAQASTRWPRRMHLDVPDHLAHYAPSSGSSSLERVHLSYCTNLTLTSIICLLNNCQKLTHLSLTGVQAFLRSDLEQFCREAPPEFTEHQRNVFCVFSGQGVMGLRSHLNKLPLNHAYDPLANGPVDDDEDQTMTGTDHATLMMSAAALNADEDDADGDEELDDADDNGGASFNHGQT
ncbi:SCF E3 ubiquitin ligase complex F-box protein-like protein grrA [Acephala macrosclerotiorum]|nr:SCF E3 ubiquitin ligase complex F-box protein-like protein grrA [Acephala macrosclerotiorum]